MKLSTLVRLGRGVAVLGVLAASAAFLAGCETRYLDVDPVVDYGDQAPYEPTGDPTLHLGYYVEQLYQELEPEGGCPIIYGLQGGTWTMPALRMRGIATTADIACSLVTDGSETLGTVASAQSRFYLAPDGWVEIQALPVPAAHAPPREADPVSDLYGVGATLSCTVTDAGGRTATATVHVVLEEG